MNKLANNIKSLRLSMGETQEDLAYALDLNSKSAVVNWESGDNVPSSENLHRISNRYGVTIDQLMNDDLTSEFSFIKYFCNVNSADELIKLFMNLFPVILLESEKSNLKLVEAIECQKNLKICMIRGDNQEEFDFYYDKTSYIYMELIDKEESVSANANLVSMFLLCAFYNRIGKEWDGIQDCFEFSNKSLRKKELKRFISEIYLSRNLNKLNKERSEYHLLNETILELIKELKYQKKLIQLSDYFMCLRYFLGLVDNNLNNAINQQIGFAILSDLSLMKNKYVGRIYNYLDELKKVQ